MYEEESEEEAEDSEEEEAEDDVVQPQPSIPPEEPLPNPHPSMPGPAMPAQRLPSKAGMPNRNGEGAAPIRTNELSKAAMPTSPIDGQFGMIPQMMPPQMMPPQMMSPPAQMQMMPFNGQPFQMMHLMRVQPTNGGIYVNQQFMNQHGQIMRWASKISIDTVSLVM